MTRDKNYFPLRLPDDLNKRIRQLAKTERRSINSQILTLLELGLGEYEGIEQMTNEKHPRSDTRSERSND